MIIDGLLEGRAGSGTYVGVPRERLRLVRSRRGEQTGSGSPSVVGLKERGKPTPGMRTARYASPPLRASPSDSPCVEARNG
ncbi:hypothetical protein [Streptomyces sp. NBC_00299]|uniref:hypothetical protein n=1 Tax=Streptomyces sp. NBC_00299 TaxID=2975705 RepID=UPI002E282EF5|nr:hypothetical protein [Streptomyces sp. NBC_00299]